MKTCEAVNKVMMIAW